MHPYTTIKIVDTIASGNSCALVVRHGDIHLALDGLDGDAIRGIALMLNRAADLSDTSAEPSEYHALSEFSLTYQIEWFEEVRPWSLNADLEPDDNNRYSEVDYVWTLKDRMEPNT